MRSPLFNADFFVMHAVSLTPFFYSCPSGSSLFAGSFDQSVMLPR